MNLTKYLLILLTGLILTACGESAVEQESTTVEYKAELTELSDEEYPDNPDISIRHDKYVETEMSSVVFAKKGNLYNLTVYPKDEEDDTILMQGINLMEFMPSIPEFAEEDEYMSLIAVVNQEWNRNQVKWESDALTTITPRAFHVNGELITRIDLARNCLNSYLWELFFYAEVDGKNKVFYHGWFDFPPELYAELFEARNGVSFEKYSEYLETWKNPANQRLEVALIREIVEELTPSFGVHNDEMYPLKGERKKKQIDIIYPVEYSKMSDFHTDSSLFATFSQPGFYNRKDPRKTELGRFQSLNRVFYRKTKAHSGELLDEVAFEFSRANGEITQFIVGGLDFATLPHLTSEEANSGKAYSMGIANHPFYESSEAHEQLCSLNNPYFGVLLDEQGNWLDSHAIGIDGPLLHLDRDDPNTLHVWLLSFERQALVGHYTIQLSE